MLVLERLAAVSEKRQQVAKRQTNAPEKKKKKSISGVHKILN